MKLVRKNIRLISSVMLMSLLLMGCKEEWKKLDLNSEADIVQFKIDDRIAVINNEAQTIDVIMPAGTSDLSSLTPAISVSSGAIVSPASGEVQNFSDPVEYMVTSGSVYKNYTVTVSIQDARILSFKIGDDEGIIDQENGTINVPMPYGTDVSNLSPEIILTDEASIAPATGVSQNFSSPVKYVLTSGSTTKEYVVMVTTIVAPDVSKGDIGTKIAFVGSGEDKSSLPDDDEQAAADWFFGNYPEADYISWEMIAGGVVNIYNYKVIWWQYDNSSELPALAAHEMVTNLFSDYLKDGGNLFFTGHACQYFWNIGRIPKQFNMAIGNGEGFENGDTWTIGVNLPAVDHRGHPLYKNVFFDEADGFFTFPVIGPGWREDHNQVMVEVASAYGYGNGDILAYASFTNDLDAEWLGVWGGIRDYFMAGIIELKPNETFKGRAIYIGIGGFEWNQNAQGNINPEGRNTYQDNIIQVSKNAIDYLSIE